MFPQQEEMEVEVMPLQQQFQQRYKKISHSSLLALAKMKVIFLYDILNNCDDRCSWKAHQRQE